MSKQTTTISAHTTIGQLVADRPARSRLFEKLGIDYCCGGKQTLQQACQSKGLDVVTMSAMLEAIDDSAAPSVPVTDASAMPLRELCDHIETTHHAYLKQELPRLQQMTRKVASVHGQVHDWLEPLAAVFEDFRQDLEMHMRKEEQVLFPMIRALDQGQPGATDHCGGLANPIRMMEHEHDQAGDGLTQMRQLSSDFTPPPSACNTFVAMLDGLQQLEADMHQHVHKENNVLFPRALQTDLLAGKPTPDRGTCQP